MTYYRDLNGEQSGCPNCGRTETSAHLCMCPSEGRTKLFLDTTDKLETWLNRDEKTEPELVFWIPKYILMRGTRSLLDMGLMSPQMRRLARSQDKIGWRNFMEGRISKEFFEIQGIYLVLGCHKLNGEQWVKQFIGKILHITHSQWIFRNFTLHDKQKGWLRRKDMKDIMGKIENLWETDVDDIPEDSRFLLEMDYDRLMQSDIHNKTYWVVATEAAIVAGKRRAGQGIRKRTQRGKRTLKSTKARLGIIDVEKEIRSYDWAYTITGRGRTKGSSHSNTAITTPSKRKSSNNTSENMTRNNKRYKPGD